MDLEKAYDRVYWLALWEVLRIYGVGGKLLNPFSTMTHLCNSTMNAIRLFHLNQIDKSV